MVHLHPTLRVVRPDLVLQLVLVVLQDLVVLVLLLHQVLPVLLLDRLVLVVLVVLSKPKWKIVEYILTKLFRVEIFFLSMVYKSKKFTNSREKFVSWEVRADNTFFRVSLSELIPHRNILIFDSILTKMDIIKNQQVSATCRSNVISNIILHCHRKH